MFHSGGLIVNETIEWKQNLPREVGKWNGWEDLEKFTVAISNVIKALVNGEF